MALLLAIVELTAVAELAVAPRFGTLAMVLVILELTTIQVALSVGKDAEAVSLATFPFTLIDVAISVLQSAFTLEQAVHGDARV